MKKYSFLIYGLGSIGQRYLRLLRKMYGDSVDIYVIRKLGKELLIDQSLLSARRTDPASYYDAVELRTFEEVSNLEIDLAVISTPIHSHLNDLKNLMKIKEVKRILVEKPIFGQMDLEETKFLENDFDYKRISVGYQFRYHPMFYKVKSYIEELDPSDIFRVSLWFQENLSSMHPYEDYKQSHMGKAKQLGFPSICFSHDVNMLLMLFQDIKIKDSFASYSKSHEIDVPDFQEIFFESASFPTGTGLLSFDFYRWPPAHGGEIVFRNGILKWNWIDQTCTKISKKSGMEVFSYDNLSRDELFENQLEYVVGLPSDTEDPYLKIDLKTDLLLQNIQKKMRTIK